MRRAAISLAILAAVAAFGPAGAEEPWPAESLFHLDSTWTTADGKPAPLSALSGRPSLVALFFSHCETACPVVIGDMKRIEASLSEEERSGTSFVLVSIDPENDDAERLAKTRDRLGLDPERWTLLTGESSDVRELAAALGIRYRRHEPLGFVHSNRITLLDGKGRIVARRDGAGGKIDPIVGRLRDALGP